MRHRLLTAAVAALALTPLAAAGAAPVRPTDLLEHPGRYLDRAIEVAIVEPLGGPATPEALAAAEQGQVEVFVPDAGGNTLVLVPGAYRQGDPRRFRHKFDRVLAAPLRVRGELLLDDEMAKARRRPYHVIRVSSLEPLVPGPATVVRSLAEIAADPARWDRRLVVYEGSYRRGFEVSALDGEIWLRTDQRTAVVGGSVPSGGLVGRRVRVTGFLFARSGARYGHLGGYRFMLSATRLELLPSR
jgi:hypothetical protein